jgi:V8-like Glu-specific endopeptidase
MYEISARTSFPYAAVTYISVTFPDGYSVRGSGSVVGVNDVLTAMHVVYQAQHGGWASSISVLPGADTLPSLVAPYGTFSDWGRVNSRTPNWDPNGDGYLSDTESQWDLALIGLRSRIGDTTGWLGLSAQSADFYATMVGYPGRGTGMMEDSGYAAASRFAGVFDSNTDLGAGASGGPLLDAGHHVVGVLSGGAFDESSSTYAALFGSGTWDWLMGAMASNDDLIGGGTSSFAGTLGPDVLTGNGLNNTMTGLAGDDRFVGGGGNDSIDGGSGIDTAVYAGVRAAYRLSLFGSSATLSDSASGRDGVDTLVAVERLAFGDVGLALDLSGNAGTVAKTIGAVFGAAAVANKAYVGIGLRLVDQGMSFNDLMQYAIDAGLGPRHTNQQLVTLLYTNVIGTAPPQSELAFYQGLLDSGQMTQGSLGVLAAETTINQTHIDLVGLASRGLEFLAA